MSVIPVILAESDYTRLIFLVVAGAIALIHGAIKSMGKKSASQQLQDSLKRTRESIQSDRSRARPPVQLAPQVRLRVPTSVPARVPLVRKFSNLVRVAATQSARVQPPPQPVATRAAKQQLIATPEPAPAASVVSKPSVTVNAPALVQWLRPATLRQQFILTEIFQKPLALREQRF